MKQLTLYKSDAYIVTTLYAIAISLLVSCNPIKSIEKKAKMSNDVIEQALVKAEIIKSFKKVEESGMRIHIDEETEDVYFINYGPLDPYKGGSGSNYSIDKKTGEVTLLSTENLAELPDFSTDEEN